MLSPIHLFHFGISALLLKVELIVVSMDKIIGDTMDFSLLISLLSYTIRFLCVLYSQQLQCSMHHVNKSYLDVNHLQKCPVQPLVQSSSWISSPLYCDFITIFWRFSTNNDSVSGFMNTVNILTVPSFNC